MTHIIQFKTKPVDFATDRTKSTRKFKIPYFVQITILYTFLKFESLIVCMLHASVKAHVNRRNKCQQLPTLLGVVGQQCCARLHGPKSLTGFKLYATSANKCQHCCGSMQTDVTSYNIVGPNNVGCCWPTIVGPFAWAFLFITKRDVQQF